MDTNEEYIKMCDCPKIQKLRSDIPHIHDFVHDPDHYDNVIKNSGWQENSIWLPRQDQIQEMIEWKHGYTFHRKQAGYTGNMIDTWDNPVRGITMDSMEQLWLAFYMLEKHQKSWGLEGWVNEKDNSTG